MRWRKWVHGFPLVAGQEMLAHLVLDFEEVVHSEFLVRRIAPPAWQIAQCVFVCVRMCMCATVAGSLNTSA